MDSVVAKDEFVKIPSFSRYSVSKDGNIRDDKKQQLVVPTYNRAGIVVVNLKNNRDNDCSVPVARLVLVVFSPIQEHEYPYVSVTYKDLDQRNVCLSNLMWNFAVYKPLFVPDVNITDNTFVTVFGHDNYRINATGEFTTSTGKRLFGNTDSYGYTYVTIAANNKERARRVAIHRLVALTFLEHPIDTTGFIINHKDGNTRNNHFRNLEWCSYTANIDHAYNNMRSQNLPILAMNIATRETISHYSLRDFCQNVGIPHGAIWWRLRNNRNIQPYHGYYVKYVTDIRPWPKSGDNKNIYDNVEILVKDIQTGDISCYTSYGQVMRRYNLRKNSVMYQLNKPVPEPYHGVLMKKKDDRPWPEYSETDLQKFSLKTSPQSRPIRVYNTRTNETKVYSGSRAFCRETGYKAEMFVREKIKIGKPFKHYEISYI